MMKADKALAYGATRITLCVYSVRSPWRHRSKVAKTAKGYDLLPLTPKNLNIKLIKKRRDTKDNIVSIAQHRAALAARFPKVDDVLERLSTDARATRLSGKKGGWRGG
jgi:hypothetical protein